MKSTNVSRSLAFAGLTLIACNGALVVDGKNPNQDPNSSAGASSGGTTADSSGTSTDTTRWLGNPSDCPADAPNYADPCAVAQGEICAYRWMSPDNPGAQEYRACACQFAVGAGLEWDCYEDGTGPACPDVQPVDGSDCTGSFGIDCDYPARTHCACNDPNSGAAHAGQWTCEATQPRVAVTSAPSGVDPNKAVNALSDGERAAWCQWSVDAWHGGPGYPEPVNAVDQYGYLSNATCDEIGGSLECNAALPELSTVDCEGNLALSTCSAPVSALSDCFRTAVNRWPSPTGCAAYFVVPGCSGTLLNSLAAPSSDGTGAAGNLGSAGDTGFDGMGTGGTGGTSGSTIPGPCVLKVQ